MTEETDETASTSTDTSTSVIVEMSAEELAAIALDKAARWATNTYQLFAAGGDKPDTDRIMVDAFTMYDLPHHGVEGWVCTHDGRRGVSYLNRGETYAPTLLALCEAGQAPIFRAGSWGDLVEAAASSDDARWAPVSVR